jgi:hypothetical protein
VPEIIACPRCQRKLRLDESVFGQTVQCPSCQNTFTAERPAPAAPPPPAEDQRPVYRVRDEEPPRYDEPPPRRYDEPRRPRYVEEDDEDYPRPTRRPYYGDYPRAHRGSAVQTLGILGLVFSFCLPFTLVGVILSIVAIAMGASDLGAMNRGEMDPSGRGPTKVGISCGIIALVLGGLSFIACIGFNIFNDL